MKVVVVPEGPEPLLVWALVVCLVAIIGFLTYTPAESNSHTYYEDHKKTQYITIGGESKTNINGS